jgi:hypothetical protein
MWMRLSDGIHIIKHIMPKAPREVGIQLSNLEKWSREHAWIIR